MLEGMAEWPSSNSAAGWDSRRLALLGAAARVTTSNNACQLHLRPNRHTFIYGALKVYSETDMGILFYCISVYLQRFRLVQRWESARVASFAGRNRLCEAFRQFIRRADGFLAVVLLWV